MQQPGGQTWNGGQIFQMGGPGTTGPSAGDGPDCTWAYVNSSMHQTFCKCKLVFHAHFLQVSMAVWI